MENLTQELLPNGEKLKINTSSDNCEEGRLSAFSFGEWQFNQDELSKIPCLCNHDV